MPAKQILFFGGFLGEFIPLSGAPPSMKELMLPDCLAEDAVPFLHDTLYYRLVNKRHDQFAHA